MGLMTKTIHLSCLPKVEYHLSPLGFGLAAAFCGQRVWAAEIFSTLSKREINLTERSTWVKGHFRDAHRGRETELYTQSGPGASHAVGFGPCVDGSLLASAFLSFRVCWLVRPCVRPLMRL